MLSFASRVLNCSLFLEVGHETIHFPEYKNFLTKNSNRKVTFRKMKFCFPIEKKSVDEHQPFQPKMKSKLFSNKMLYCIKGCAKRFSYELFSFFNSYVYIRHLFFNGQKLINNPISWHSSIFYSWNIVNTKGMNNKHEQENNPPIIDLKKKSFNN